MNKMKNIFLSLALLSGQLSHGSSGHSVQVSGGSNFTYESNSQTPLTARVNFCETPYDMSVEGTQARGICLCAQLALDSVKQLGTENEAAVTLISQEYAEGEGDFQSAIYHIEARNSETTHWYEVYMQTPPETDCEVLSILALPN